MVFGILHDLATYYGQDYHGANSTTYTENLNLILIQPFYFDCKMIKLELLECPICTCLGPPTLFSIY